MRKQKYPERFLTYLTHIAFYPIIVAVQHERIALTIYYF